MACWTQGGQTAEAAARSRGYGRPLLPALLQQPALRKGGSAWVAQPCLRVPALLFIQHQPLCTVRMLSRGGRCDLGQQPCFTGEETGTEVARAAAMITGCWWQIRDSVCKFFVAFELLSNTIITFTKIHLCILII